MNLKYREINNKSMEFPLCLVEKIEGYINDLYLLEHQTRFKLIFINEIHDKFIKKRIGQYKELIENLPKGNCGFGYYLRFVKEIQDLRFKHID